MTARHGHGAINPGSGSRGDSTDLGLLPILPNQHWYLKSMRCKHFNKPGGCHRGLSCRYAHIRSPLGEVLDDEERFARVFPFKLDPQALRFHSVGNWYTAAYYDNDERVLHYAERGPSSRLSKQGVYWYPNRRAAEEAIRRAMIVWKYRS